MALYQEGSDAAFKTLYSRYSGKVFGYLKSRSSSPQEAAEWFQEVFVKIHKSKHLYNTSLPVSPWIFSVAHSVLLDGLRSRNRKKEILEPNLDALSEAPQTENVNLADITPLIHRLPPNQNLALHLRYVDEQTFTEIAKTLNTSPSNVRQLISRGVKNLKRLILEGVKS